MLFIVSVVGFLGAAVFGLVGLSRGDAGQLERILAIACLAKPPRAWSAAGFGRLEKRGCRPRGTSRSRWATSSR